MQFKGQDYVKPDPEIMKTLVEYKWPGNVRELQNVLKRLVVLNEWEEVIDELGRRNSPEFKHGIAGKPEEYSVIADLLDLSENQTPDLSEFSFKKIKKKAINKVEREAIAYVLDKTGWNRSKASKILEISYKTLLNKIAELDITPPESPDKQTG